MLQQSHFWMLGVLKLQNWSVVFKLLLKNKIRCLSMVWISQLGPVLETEMQTLPFSLPPLRNIGFFFLWIFWNVCKQFFIKIGTNCWSQNHQKLRITIFWHFWREGRGVACRSLGNTTKLFLVKDYR